MRSRQAALVGLLLPLACGGCEGQRRELGAAPADSPSVRAERSHAPMPMTILAWSFDSDLGAPAMLKKLNELGLGAWEEGDSAHHDYLAGRLTKEGVARIYAVGAHHVVNLRFYSKEGDAQAELRAAKQVLLDRVLPALGARDVKPTEPFE